VISDTAPDSRVFRLRQAERQLCTRRDHEMFYAGGTFLSGGLSCYDPKSLPPKAPSDRGAPSWAQVLAAPAPAWPPAQATAQVNPLTPPWAQHGFSRLPKLDLARVALAGAAAMVSRRSSTRRFIRACRGDAAHGPRTCDDPTCPATARPSYPIRYLSGRRS